MSTVSVTCGDRKERERVFNKTLTKQPAKSLTKFNASTLFHLLGMPKKMVSWVRTWKTHWNERNQDCLLLFLIGSNIHFSRFVSTLFRQHWLVRRRRSAKGFCKFFGTEMSIMLCCSWIFHFSKENDKISLCTERVVHLYLSHGWMWSCWPLQVCRSTWHAKASRSWMHKAAHHQCNRSCRNWSGAQYAIRSCNAYHW